LAPVYFNLTKYSSFQRQCHMYHFQRITCGPDKGAYHHPSFLRGRPDLAMLIQRTRVNGKGVRRPGNPDKEPDFYSLPFRPPVTPLNFLGNNIHCNSVVSIGDDNPVAECQRLTTTTTMSANVVLVGGGGVGV
jgi:HSF-type DNA-binding